MSKLPIAKKLCQTGSNLLDVGQTVVNAMDFVLNSAEGKRLTKELPPEARSALEGIRGISKPAIAASREVFKVIDSILTGPLCKKASALKMKTDGAELARMMFKDPNKARQICNMANKFISAIKGALEIAGRIVNSFVVSTALTAVAPRVKVVIDTLLPKAQKVLSFVIVGEKVLCSHFAK